MKIIYPESNRPIKPRKVRVQRIVDRPLWPNAPWNWETVKDNGRQVWQGNMYTSKRRILINEMVAGYQPIDQIWLNGGEWKDERMVLWT